MRKLEARAEVILCESSLDSLTFWCAGIRNVTVAYWVNGFTPDRFASRWIAPPMAVPDTGTPDRRWRD